MCVGTLPISYESHNPYVRVRATVTTCLCECREDSVLHACLAHVCLVKGRGRQVKREMEKERDMSHHPQDVSSF